MPPSTDEDSEPDEDLSLSSPAAVFVQRQSSIDSLGGAKNPTGMRAQTRVTRPSEWYLILFFLTGSCLFLLCQISMSVRSELTTVTDTPPAPTQPAASNATAHQDGLAMASNAQVRPRSGDRFFQFF